MPKIIHRTTLTIATLTILTVALYNATSIDIILTFAITLGTTSYHFIMRLLVGLIFNLTMRNRADYTKSWYQVSNFENRIYKKLNVKKWKNRMPTYDSSLFDTKIHSLQEIVQAMCQAELVHETNFSVKFCTNCCRSLVWCISCFCYYVGFGCNVRFDVCNGSEI